MDTINKTIKVPKWFVDELENNIRKLSSSIIKRYAEAHSISKEDVLNPPPKITHEVADKLFDVSVKKFEKTHPSSSKKKSRRATEPAVHLSSIGTGPKFSKSKKSMKKKS